MRCPQCASSIHTKCGSQVDHVQHFRCSVCSTIYDKSQSLSTERARNKPKKEKFRGEPAGLTHRHQIMREILAKNERERRAG